MHARGDMINGVLKQQYGFDGFVISDWQGINQIGPDYETDVKTGVNAGIDMVMVPDQYANFEHDLTDLVSNGGVTQARIDDAVKRAKHAYEIATKSLFRDCSCYSFDKYQQELATDLSLADLQRFTERFLGEHRQHAHGKVRRTVRAQCHGVGRLRGEVLGDDGAQVITREHNAAGQQVEERRPERVDVGAA